MDSREETRKEIQTLYFTYVKHHWIYPIIVIFVVFIDIALIVLYYYFTYMRPKDAILLSLLLVHVGASVSLFAVRRRSSPQTKNISPIVFLILPGIGALIYGSSYISLYLIGAKKAQYEIKHAYADEEELTYEKSVSIDFDQVSKLMDMSGVFTYSSALHKKEVIVDLLAADIIKNCRTLKRGLEDEDPEVVHYTASALNYLENRFEKAIRDARDEVAKNLTKENIERLTMLYENYIDSGLLEDDIIPIYLKKVIEVLELYVDTFGPDSSVIKHLAKAYMKQGRGADALEILQRIAREHPEDVEIQLTLMQYFYEAGDLVQVANVAKIIDLLGDSLTPKQQQTIQFWLKEGEETGEAKDEKAL